MTATNPTKAENAAHTSSDSCGCCGSALALSAKETCLFLVLAAAITVAIYLPHLARVFVDWDLVAYRQMLYTTDYWNTVVKLFTDFHGKVVSGYYAPIASISLMMDKWFVGSNEPSAWFTLFVNLVLHCLNGMLVFLLLRCIGATRMVSLLSASIFLMHPLQVSSVLWFSQRKGLLATAFYLLSYMGYFRYKERRSAWTYLGSLALFAVALLTKPTVVVLPVALLAWEVMVVLRDRSRVSPEADACESPRSPEPCPERQIGAAFAPRPSSRISALFKSVLPLVPFFLAALASGLMAMQSEGASMDVEGPPDVPLEDRPFIAATAIWFYVAKAVIPLDLTPIYPRWDIDSSRLAWWLPLLGLGIVSALIIRYRERIGTTFFGCLANFLVPLLPVIGLMKFAYLRLAYVSDHFMYLPMVGMAGLLGVSIVAALSRVSARVRPVLAVAAVVYLGFLGLQTWSYAAAWKDSVTFWSYNLTHNPLSWSSETYLGHALISAGRAQEAIPHFKQTIAMKKAYIEDRIGRGERLQRTGNRSAAARELAQAANVEKTLGMAYHNLGNALLLSQRQAEAIKQYETAIRLKPNQVNALTNLGVCHIALENFPEAVRYLSRAVELSPNNFEAQYNLGYALRMQGNRLASDEHFAKARSLRPDVPLPEFSEEHPGNRQKTP